MAETDQDAATQTNRERGKGGQRGQRAGGGVGRERKGAASATPATADEMRDLLFTVSRVAGAFEAMLRTREPSLTLTQWAVLESLGSDGKDARPAQVARKLSTSRQMVRQATKKLEAMKLIETVPAAEGKKAVGIKLNDAGRQVLTSIGETSAAVATKLAADQPALKVAGTNRALRGVAAVVADMGPDAQKAEAKRGEAAVPAPTAAVE